MSVLVEKGKEVLPSEQKYEIRQLALTDSFDGSYELEISSVKIEKERF